MTTTQDINGIYQKTSQNIATTISNDTGIFDLDGFAAYLVVTKTTLDTAPIINKAMTISDPTSLGVATAELDADDLNIAAGTYHYQIIIVKSVDETYIVNEGKFIVNPNTYVPPS